MYIFLLFSIAISLHSVTGNELVIEDFNKDSDLTQWIEHSDTLRSEGKSKAALVSHRVENTQRAILFTLLNPQPCGAGFAGIKKPVNLNVMDYNTISLKVRGQGQYSKYKFIIRHYGEDTEHYPAFCNHFETNDNFAIVNLSIDEFKPYLEGKPIQDTSVYLNKTQISSIGILAFGGAYLPEKQSGVGSLEIDWIKMTKQ